MNKPVHFRDEIRRSFITYSIVPAVIFAAIVLIVYIFIWHWNLYQKAYEENMKITAVFDQAVSAYRAQVERSLPVSVASLVCNSSAVSAVYAGLKGYILNQRIQADFTVLSPSYRIVLEGDSGKHFVVPAWQNDFSWGTLGRMKKRPEDTVIEISSDYNPESVPEIVIGRALSENGKIAGYLIFTITGKDVKKEFNTMLPFAITNARHVFFLGSSPGYRDQLDKLPEFYVRRSSYYFIGKTAVYHRTTSGGLFDVYTFSDTEQLNNTVAMMLIMTLAVLGLMIRGLFFSAAKISEEKSATIDKIVEAYRKVEDGNLDSRLDVESNVEFQAIADAYNDMLGNVKRLIEEKACETREKYIAELKQLEMQFNPHFLYNTLENIKFLIKLDPDKAQKTILCLSELLRYSINNEVSVVPVGEDMHYIENYLYILKMRFGSRFEYAIDVPDSVNYCLAPKLILQPLIGNSVKYGFEDCENMKILITARILSGRLVVSVRDNGTGIEKERLREIRSLLKGNSNDTSHIGLYNVQRRIQLMYGAAYGLRVDSVRGEGTVAKIVLPCVRGDGT